MKSGSRGDVSIQLGRAEALVLFELLHELEDDERWSSDAAERLALWRLTGALERVLTEPFRPDWRRLVDEARAQLRREAGE